MATENNNWLWLGGFWDGEGSFGVYTTTTSTGKVIFNPYASIVGTNRDIIDQIATLIDGKVTLSHVSGGNRKEAYRVRLTGRKAVAFAAKILPYLKLKNPQASLLIQWEFRSKGGARGALYSLDEQTFNLQKDIYMRAKILNQRGIPAGDLS